MFSRMFCLKNDENPTLNKSLENEKNPFLFHGSYRAPKILQLLTLSHMLKRFLLREHSIIQNPEKIQQQNTTFNVCQDVLKRGNLLHKRGLDDSQSHTAVHWQF